MTGTQTTDQIFISKLTGIVIENLANESFGVKDLAHKSGMSLYHLSRKLHSISKKNVNQFIREIRLQKALEMLKTEEYTASEVAYRTGFGSPAYFTKCFHKFYGVPPGHVKKESFEFNEKYNLTKSLDLNENNDRKLVNYFTLRSLLFLILFSISIGVISYKLIHNFNRRDDLVSADGRISLAVMPFKNLTNDTTWNIWQEGIQTCLAASLSNAGELQVRQTEYVNSLMGPTSYTSLTPTIASYISKKLDATLFIYGSFTQAGEIIRLNAQVINSKTRDALRSFQIDGREEEILKMTDSLSLLMRNSLIISRLEKIGSASIHESYLKSVKSPEAYRYFIQGQVAFYNNDFTESIKMFLQALKLDSTIVGALGKISLAYYNLDNYEKGRVWCLKSYAKQDMMTMKEKMWNESLYSIYFRTFGDRIKYLKQLINIDDENPMVYFNIGDCYFEMLEYEKAIPEFEKALQLFKKWDIKPYWGAFYYELGISYHKTHQYKEEKKLYRKAERDFPGDPGLLDQNAWLALASGDTLSANRYIEKWKMVRTEEQWSESRINWYIAYIYNMAEDTDKAEKYLRKSLSLEPGNPERLNSLAYFLIDKNRDVDEGLELVNKALELKSDSYSLLHTKGWGLYKQRRYKEALCLLEKSWDLKPRYFHTIYLHLEAARKSVNGQ